jgi:hypothetical protein
MAPSLHSEGLAGGQQARDCHRLTSEVSTGKLGGAGRAMGANWAIMGWATRFLEAHSSRTLALRRWLRGNAASLATDGRGARRPSREPVSGTASGVFWSFWRPCFWHSATIYRENCRPPGRRRFRGRPYVSQAGQRRQKKSRRTRQTHASRLSRITNHSQTQPILFRISISP